MRTRVLVLAAALGAASVIGIAPPAQASCTQLWIGGPCVETVVCRAVSVLPGPQYCVM
ncbi:MAG TPA: hypothetical protein VHN37_00725 [Actinomycetota bacterium]|nr:hypothetical protein [Actinomycetota bacterium]